MRERTFSCLYSYLKTDSHRLFFYYFAETQSKNLFDFMSKEFKGTDLLSKKPNICMSDMTTKSAADTIIFLRRTCFTHIEIR